jgi:hypothetical protein
MARFFKLTPEMGKLLRENLTLSEWKLWSLFVDYDSFGDKYVEIPPLIEILMECDISQATFYRAIAKFKKLNLFDFQYDKAYIRNLSSSTALSLTHENPTITHENSSIYKDIKNLRLSQKHSQNFQNRRERRSKDFAKKKLTFSQNHHAWLPNGFSRT